ncbi:hypothetical protein FH972_005676 [Carpinus fangiana]|uniref:Uncharacterized protein n=1 Tax=Carpinus fangiana TaxID=176857 RepID=A0A5N6QPZ4_9ROSI|nr:hypothetical protein FH972_005676 [Carpinus fangiana]
MPPHDVSQPTFRPASELAPYHVSQTAFKLVSHTASQAAASPHVSRPVSHTAAQHVSQSVRVLTSAAHSAGNAAATTQLVKTSTPHAYKQNASTIFGNKKKITLELATRNKAGGRLREHVRSGRELANKQKLVVDLSGSPDRPPPILGDRPLCFWGPPRVGGITFRIAPHDFDI